MRYKYLIAAVITIAMLLGIFPTPVRALSFSFTPVQGTMGTEITIANICTYGSGDFAIYWGDAEELVKKGTALGCQAVSFTAPESAGGKNKVILKISSKIFEAEFNILPYITMSPGEGFLGSALIVNGKGFLSNESGIQILFDRIPVQLGINADKKGNWQGIFKIPQSKLGEHNISAAGTTPVEQVNNVILKVKPKIEINPVNGSAGTMVTVEGNGFGGGEADIKITYDEITVKTAIAANSSGFWRSSFLVPPSTRGSHKISAAGTMSAASPAAAVAFSISPLLKLELAAGALGSVLKSGDNIWLSGISFEENEPNIKVTFDGSALTSNITADAKGSWTIRWQVPESSYGEHLIRASGNVTTENMVTGVSLIISPTMQINPDSGTIGQVISAWGNGFGSSREIIIRFDNGKVAPGTRSDTKGNFKAEFKMPESVGGEHIITCSDVSGALAMAIFTIESTAPKSPSLFSPAASANITGEKDTTLIFQWEKVEDPSGVSYWWELSHDANFSDLVMRQEALTENQYVFTGLADARVAELTAGEYFWRVRAIDGVRNASDWSVIQSFNIPPPPPPEMPPPSPRSPLVPLLVTIGIILGIIIIWRIISISRHNGWK